jgi:hypothetical protein
MMTLAPRDRRRSVDIAANSPRVGKIERRVRRLLIVRGDMTTPQLMQAIYPSPPTSSSLILPAAPRM